MKKIANYLKNALKNISAGGVLMWSDYALFMALCVVIYALFLRELL